MLLPGSLRFFTKLADSNTAPTCTYSVYWVDPTNAQTLIFSINAQNYLEMVELEIGSVTTYATVWTANKN